MHESVIKVFNSVHEIRLVLKCLSVMHFMVSLEFFISYSKFVHKKVGVNMIKLLSGSNMFSNALFLDNVHGSRQKLN